MAGLAQRLCCRVIFFFNLRIKNNESLQKEYIQLLLGLFKSALTDKMIEVAYMTGILPIKKYGTQSAMTDFVEYTIFLQ